MNQATTGVAFFIRKYPPSRMPAAHKYGEEYTATLGIILGMAVMVATLALLG